jgi:hypothetical protein
MTCTMQGRSCSLWSSCSPSPGCCCARAARRGARVAGRGSPRRGAALCPVSSSAATIAAWSRPATRTGCTATGSGRCCGCVSRPSVSAGLRPASRRAAMVRPADPQVLRVVPAPPAPALLPAATVRLRPAGILPSSGYGPALPPGTRGATAPAAFGCRSAVPAPSARVRRMFRPPRGLSPRQPGRRAHPDPAAAKPRRPLSPRCGTSPARHRPRPAVPHRAQSRLKPQPSPNLRPLRESS